jgi:acetyl esterase/lipase
MPRRLKTLAIATPAALLVLVLVALWLLLGQTNLDRSTADYRGRMQAIWTGTPPGTPDSHAVPLDIDSGVLRYLFINEYESEVPYLVQFPARPAGRSPTASPALLILPGGGYSFRSEQLDGLDVAGWFSKHGVAAFVLNYRVAPYRYPVPLQDAQRAMRWLRAHAAELGIDARRLGVVGSSAGGHLAALLATEPGYGDADSADPVERQRSRPDVLVLSQAVISMQQHVHEGSRRRLLGTSPNPQLLSSLSAERRVDPTTPPTFVWTTRTDGMVDPQNSELFASALAEHGVEHELLIFPEGPHGRGLFRAEKYARDWPQRCLTWLTQVGFVHPNGH